MDFLNEKIKIATEIFDKRKNFIENDNFRYFIIDCYINLTPQSYGGKINKRIIKEINALSVSPRLDKGDCITKNGKFIEIKASFLSTTETWNFIQIRPHQKIDYYIFLIIDNINSFTEKLIIIDENDITKFKLHSIHGTKTSNVDNKNIEYKITIRRDSDEYRLLLNTNLLKDNSVEGLKEFFNN